jgi:hypothetical protein
MVVGLVASTKPVLLLQVGNMTATLQEEMISVWIELENLLNWWNRICGDVKWYFCYFNYLLL